MFEKLVYKRTRPFLDKHFFFILTQCGFRPLHSFNYATLDILTIALDNINEDKNTAIILLDLKKTFDSVSHEILLGKLYQNGVEGNVHKLFSSFMSNRQQFVASDDTKSDKTLIVVLLND